ncbi:hypothetical protein QAD02_009864 [Eretmocerus hayati]|uniref:Uncharacterized protein n=1 Tax=Eretmocerus hayati TaxID=131215 RepID=A0ACC2NBY1_9HYME|nr:hypothetical protein QAD02_009864 [Eretmocerus hayati]
MNIRQQEKLINSPADKLEISEKGKTFVGNHHDKLQNMKACPDSCPESTISNELWQRSQPKDERAFFAKGIKIGGPKYGVKALIACPRTSILTPSNPDAKPFFTLEKSQRVMSVLVLVVFHLSSTSILFL